MDRTIRLGEIVALEERGRRQQHVGVQRGVGHHLFEHHGEQIVAFEPAEDAALIGNGRRGVAVVDEQHVNRRIVVLGQRAAEVIHVDDARVGLGRIDPRAIDIPRRRVAHRIAAAAHTELTADGRQRQHGHRRVASVAVALQPPAAANQRRNARGIQLRHLFDRLGGNSGDLRRACERPRLGLLAQTVGAVRVLAQKRLVGEAVREEVSMDGQRDDDVGAGRDGEMDVGRPGERGGSRIDDDELRAALLGLAHVRDRDECQTRQD